jgi:hypothetical protein
LLRLREATNCSAARPIATVAIAKPLWTEPGWNDHTPAEMRIDSFRRTARRTVIIRR